MFNFFPTAFCYALLRVLLWGGGALTPPPPVSMFNARKSDIYVHSKKNDRLTQRVALEISGEDFPIVGLFGVGSHFVPE